MARRKQSRKQSNSYMIYGMYAIVAYAAYNWWASQQIPTVPQITTAAPGPVTPPVATVSAFPRFYIIKLSYRGL